MEEKTLETLAGEIASSGTVCRLKGTYRLDLAAAKTVVCGEERFGCLLALSRPGLVVDGRGGRVVSGGGCAAFGGRIPIFLTPQAEVCVAAASGYPLYVQAGTALLCRARRRLPRLRRFF